MLRMERGESPATALHSRSHVVTLVSADVIMMMINRLPKTMIGPFHHFGENRAWHYRITVRRLMIGQERIDSNLSAL